MGSAGALFLLAVLSLALNSGEGRRLQEPVLVRIKNHKGSTPNDSPGYPRCVNGNNFEHRALCHSVRGEYYGASGKTSIYSLPQVKTNQNSYAAIQVINDESNDGSQGQLNMIQAGWQVNPDLNGDTRTRLFTHWTVDHNQSTGCFNVECPGFVIQSGTPMKPGSILPVSDYGGQQKYMTLTIYKDPASGNWWLTYDDDTQTGVRIGFWPSSLFTTLGRRATIIGYGGFVSFPIGSEGPPMGSGHFSSEGEGKAAAFENLHFLDQSLAVHEFTNATALIDAPKCYDVSSPVDSGDGGLSFYFGGPQGCIEQD